MAKLITEMSDAQKVALELYLKVDDDYKPSSYAKLSSEMLACGFQASSSTLQRWAKECDFEYYLNQHINALILADDKRSKDLDTAAGQENFKRTLLSLEDNAELTSGSYKGLKLLLQQILEDANSGKKISKEDAKLLIQIYSISSARDDKLLDRKTYLAGVERLTKADLLSQFSKMNVSVEELEEEALDAEIEMED